MVVYAALVSLLHTLDSILHPTARGRKIYHNRAQLKSLREKVSFLLDFLENSPSDYGQRKHSGIYSLERRMSYAAYKARDVIEHGISNQFVEGADFRFYMFFFLIIFYVPLVINIAHLLIVPLKKKDKKKMLIVALYKVIALWIKTLISAVCANPISVQSLFQNVICVLAWVWIPPAVLIFVPLLILIAGVGGYVVYVAVLIGINFAGRCLLYAFARENQDLRPLIDDISLIMEEAIRIKDCRGSGQSADSDSAHGLSRRDFGGTGKNVAVGGLDSDLKEICGRLIGYPSQLEIVSIVGMGGIGKTTLARQVHDDPYMDYHFDICAWVTVSQNYSVRRVILGLLDSAKIRTQEVLQKHKECCDDVLAQKLGEHLYKNLMSRMYLIVMDDVWDTEVWDSVRRFFPENCNGSRVLLTTRLSGVASYANPDAPPLQMRFLNDGESWHLLRDKVFGGECCPPELEAIGRTIARNCRGLPLAIVVVGGLLYNEHRTVRDWEIVSNNLSSILGKDDEQCLEILGLSYSHLPHRLKPCFLYMGAFREGEEIHVTRLFNLWVAEGLLEANKSKSLEEVAEEYLKDLIQRSLILVGKLSCNGKIRTCKVHDLIRDVCWLNAYKENFLHFAKFVEKEGSVLNRIPIVKTLLFSFDGGEGGSGLNRSPIFKTHLFGQGSGLNEPFMYSTSFFDSPGYTCKPPCSYMFRSFISDGFCSHVPLIYVGFRLVRVLDLVGTYFSSIPYTILILVHLRYLGIDVQCIDSISRLWNLQTIVFYSEVYEIPLEIWSMQNLRHLYFCGSFLPDPLRNSTVLENLLTNLRHLYFWGGFLPYPPGFPILRSSTVLEDLQTLVGISNFRCTKGILKSIPNLKKLGISYYVNRPVDWWSEYEPESLVNLHQLETLKITVTLKYLVPVVCPPKLAFPEKLKKLTLEGCRMPWESMRIVGALPNLQVLKLRKLACVGPTWEPVEEEFCQLMFLLLEDMDLEQWRANEAHFPHLQRLILRHLYKLAEIPCDIGEIATLEMLELVDCLPSAVASAQQIQ